MIIEQIIIGRMAVFCYLIGDEKSGEGALIDPAGDPEKILTIAKKYQLSVRWVINTHGHCDHTAGNRSIMKKTGGQLLIHRNDVPKLRKPLNRLFSRVLGGAGSPKPAQFLNDGDTIPIGSISLRAIHTPGHSPGSLCLYTKGHIFTGDTLFTEGTGRTDFADGSQHEIMDSIKNRILTLPDDTIIWPGHHYGRHPSSTVKEQKKFYF